MPSTSDSPTYTRLEADREDMRVAYLAALAVGIHVAEAALPSVLPGIKPGLANVVTVAVLVRYGWRTAAWVALLRSLAGSLLVGTFLAPTFFLSFSGATAAVASLWLLRGVPGIGPVGLSVPASMAHLAAQFVVAWLVFIPHQGLLALLPPLMTAALVTGTLNGIIATMMLNRLDTTPDPARRATAG